MNKSDLLLSALAAGEKSEYTPVQIQKLMFLLDKNISNRLGGPFFDFRPYDYGPFDASIYEDLRELERQGYISTSPSSRGWKKYQLTDTGLSKAKESSAEIDAKIFDYIKAVSNFVRSLSFADLVSSIYKAYPEMKVNSIFKGN
ncbi:hypothetical protein [Methylotenera sp.]|uniref:hypothetical protein n=1 Tax=Methylotenera sp. TaxID=2051956 RepID=UPI002EDB0182